MRFEGYCGALPLGLPTRTGNLGLASTLCAWRQWRCRVLAELTCRKHQVSRQRSRHRNGLSASMTGSFNPGKDAARMPRATCSAASGTAGG